MRALHVTSRNVMEALPRVRPDSARQVTISDVASRAGVGVGTVSRVLNGSPLVRQETRVQVLAVIDELDYRPSQVARRLSLGRTMTVAAVVPYFTNPSFVERLRGLMDGLSDSDYEFTLLSVQTEQQRDEHLDALARGGRADGVIVLSLPLSELEAKRFQRADVPVVMVDVSHPAFPSVAIDNVAGGRLATRHLLDLGHRRIGFVGDPEVNLFGFTASADRRRGYSDALTSASIDLEPKLVRLGAHGRDVAHRLTDELLGLSNPPTAIFAATDTQALGVLEAATLSGLRVPEDLSVVGFDDIEVAPYIGLTTVRQPLEASGRAGADLILRALAGEPIPPVAQILDLELIVRRTTGAPK